MRSFLQKRWFLISLVLLITAGLTLGTNTPSTGATLRSSLFRPRMITGIILFLMTFSLDSHQLKRSFRSPAPVFWASLVNYVFIPLCAWGLMQCQTVADFRYGLMIAGSVPCTLAAASVWTRRAGGNDAVALLVTLLTNSVCFIVTPLWLNLATSQGVELDTHDMILRLLQAVLIPTLLGQGVRQIPIAGRFATRHKRRISGVALIFVLSLIFMASWKAGAYLSANGHDLGFAAVVFVWGSAIVLHLSAMVVGLVGARLFGFSAADRAAIAFASSQKTLPIGVLLATDPTMFGDPNLLGAGIGVPFAIFPMLMYHASQLFIDTAVADRIASRQQTQDSDSLEPPGPST